MYICLLPLPKIWLDGKIWWIEIYAVFALCVSACVCMYFLYYLSLFISCTVPQAFFFFLDRVSLYSSVWPWTYYVAGWLWPCGSPPASGQMLGIQTYGITPAFPSFSSRIGLPRIFWTAYFCCTSESVCRVMDSVCFIWRSCHSFHNFPKGWAFPNANSGSATGPNSSSFEQLEFYQPCHFPWVPSDLPDVLQCRNLRQQLRLHSLVSSYVCFSLQMDPVLNHNTFS